MPTKLFLFKQVQFCLYAFVQRNAYLISSLITVDPILYKIESEYHLNGTLKAFQIPFQGRRELKKENSDIMKLENFY